MNASGNGSLFKASVTHALSHRFLGRFTHLPWIFLLVFLAVTVAAGMIRGFNVHHPQVNLPAVVEFGDVEPASVKTRTLVVRNTGKSALNVALSASCGCTILSQREFAVAPGDSREVPVEMRMYTYDGEMKSDLIAETNDPGNPLVKITLHANVRRRLGALPDRIDLGMLERAKLPYVAEVEVRNLEPRIEKEFVVSSADPFLVVKEIEPKQSGTFKLRIEIPASMPDGAVDREVIVQEKENPSSFAKISVVGDIVGTLYSEPPVLLFGSITIPAKTSFRVIDKEASAHPNRNWTATVDDSTGAVVSAQNAALGYFTLELATPPDKTQIKGHVVVSDGDNRLQIPFYARVKSVSKRE